MGRKSLLSSLRENADLTEKAIEFMADLEQIEEAKADVKLWREAANTIEKLERAVQLERRRAVEAETAVIRGGRDV